MAMSLSGEEGGEIAAPDVSIVLLQTGSAEKCFLGKGKAALLSLDSELCNKIVRLEQRVGPELLRLSAPPHWANLTSCSSHAWGFSMVEENPQTRGERANSTQKDPTPARSNPGPS